MITLKGCRVGGISFPHSGLNQRDVCLLSSTPILKHGVENERICNDIKGLGGHQLITTFQDIKRCFRSKISLTKMQPKKVR